jgi:hypothetical protein
MAAETEVRFVKVDFESARSGLKFMGDGEPNWVAQQLDKVLALAAKLADKPQGGM